MSPKAAAGSPVVFLHGLGGGKEDWAEVLALLPKALRAQALDLPGSAGGPKPLQGYDPESLARWVSAATFRDGITKVRLVGHSLGARVAGELAALQPERVEALVLVSPLGAASYGLTDKLKWKAMSRRAVIQNAPETSMRNASGYGFEVEGVGKRGFVERATKARTGPDGEAVARAVEKSVDGVLDARPLSERLRTTRMPLLVIAGAQDPLAPPAASRALLKARPDARFEELAGLGHYPMLEDPARVAALLKTFLA